MFTNRVGRVVVTVLSPTRPPTRGPPPAQRVYLRQLWTGGVFGGVTWMRLAKSAVNVDCELRLEKGDRPELLASSR